MPDLPWNSALVLGASGGLGLGLVDALLKEPQISRVYSTTRSSSQQTALTKLHSEHHHRLEVMNCDATNDEDLHQLAQAIAEGDIKPDLIIYAAGILHDEQVKPEKALSQLQRESMSKVFDVNTFSPLLAARVLLPVLDRTRPANFAALSAMVGSIGDNQLGGWYSYRASKAALNQLLKTLSIECRRTHPLLTVTSIHPGTTDTGLSRPYQSNVAEGRLYTPAQSARRILDVIRDQKPENSGCFVNWNGSEIPW